MYYDSFESFAREAVYFRRFCFKPMKYTQPEAYERTPGGRALAYAPAVRVGIYASRARFAGIAS